MANDVKCALVEFSHWTKYSALLEEEARDDIDDDEDYNDDDDEGDESNEAFDDSEKGGKGARKGGEAQAEMHNIAGSDGKQFFGTLRNSFFEQTLP